jgi:hypothetical protein
VAGLLSPINPHAAAYLHGYDSGRQAPHQLRMLQAVGRKFENGDIDVEIAQRVDAHRDALNAIKITRRR